MVGEEHRTDPEAIGRSGFSDEAERPRVHKAAGAFRTISEVADELHVPQHVLRFWESKFPQVRPLKRGGGRRYYRPEDVTLLRRVADLLYTEGYTIKGVQRLLRDQGAMSVVSPAAKAAPESAATPSLLDMSTTAAVPAVAEPPDEADLVAEEQLEDSMNIANVEADDAAPCGVNDTQDLRSLLLETMAALEELRRALG